MKFCKENIECFLPSVDWLIASLREHAREQRNECSYIDFAQRVENPTDGLIEMIEMLLGAVSL